MGISSSFGSRGRLDPLARVAVPAAAAAVGMGATAGISGGAAGSGGGLFSAAGPDPLAWLGAGALALLSAGA
jgi:hypothetical protein